MHVKVNTKRSTVLLLAIIVSRANWLTVESFHPRLGKKISICLKCVGYFHFGSLPFLFVQSVICSRPCRASIPSEFVLTQAWSMHRTLTLMGENLRAGFTGIHFLSQSLFQMLDAFCPRKKQFILDYRARTYFKSHGFPSIKSAFNESTHIILH